MKRGGVQKRASLLSAGILYPLRGALFIAVFAACSFDYGDNLESDKNKPDIVMENLEYVRVRDGDPIARFQAEYAERWEDRQTMELKDFSFEQLEDHGETVNAAGRAGAAEVQLGSGDISLRDGVRINIDSEDITIRTSGLEWKDKEKTLTGGGNDEVDIERSDGTSFSGRGFSADIRGRTWNFTGEVKGRYVEEEDGDTPETSAEPLPEQDSLPELPGRESLPSGPAAGIEIPPPREDK